VKRTAWNEHCRSPATSSLLHQKLIELDEKARQNRTVRGVFFSRVDELEAYKEKHGHLNVQCNEDESLYGFCCQLRHSRRAIASGKGTASYKLTDDRIAALDAIGFDWIGLDRQHMQLNKTQQMICEVNMFDCDLTFIIPQQYVFTNNQLSLTHRG
jgi:hypothetical protein